MKKLKLRQAAASSIMAFAMLTTPILSLPLYASEADAGAESTAVVQETFFDIPSVGTVALSGDSFFELKDLRSTAGSENTTVTFTVRIVNGGTEDIQFIDYWVRMQSVSGANYTINVMPQDKDKNLIPAGGEQEIKFYAQVTKGITLQDLQFQFIKWDFSSPNYQRILGTLKVDDQYSTVAPANSRANFRIGKTNFQGYIKKANVGRSEEHLLPTIQWELRNTDSRSLQLPKLTFMIRTSDGLLYPLHSNLGEAVAVDPLITKEITLTGKLPLTISEQGWELVVTEQAATGNENVTQTAFAEMQLPAFSEEIPQTERTQSFTNTEGEYIASLETIHRMPWEDQDLLTASIVLKSNEGKPLPIPEMTAYMQLDKAVKVEAQIIRTDNVIGLQPDKEVRIQLIGSIPYTYDYSELKIVLQEKSKDSTGGTGGGGTPNTATNGESGNLVAFVTDSVIDSIPTVTAGETYKIGGMGRAGQYGIHSLVKYETTSSDIVVAYLEVENLERRATDISKLIAHFQAEDGTTFPANFTEVKSKVSPSGKALIQVWSNISKSKSASVNQLLIGEAVSKGQYATEEGAADAYVNSVLFRLPAEKPIIEDSIKDIDIFPYTLSLSRVGTSVANSEVKVEFNYELSKDAQYVFNPEDYSIFFEMVDADGLAKMDWTFALDQPKVEGSKDTSPIDPTRLILGSHKMQVSKNDQEFVYKTSYMKDYRLNIYTIFQGQKRLVATKTLGWFYYSD